MYSYYIIIICMRAKDELRTYNIGLRKIRLDWRWWCGDHDELSEWVGEWGIHGYILYFIL